VTHLRRTQGVSERRACEVVEQHRSTQRYEVRERDDEKPLVAEMLALSRQHPRYGYRRITALLRRKGWTVNGKRVQRIWREQGLRVPRKQRRKRRLGASANSCVRRRAERRNHCWTYDFVFDVTEDGRTLKWLTVVDEFTRECVALEVGRSFTASAVVAVLGRCIRERGAPEFIRSDNGPEFIAEAIRAWLSTSGIDTAFVAPGAPWENAYCETFNGKLRDEFLDRELFTTVAEAKHLAAEYRDEYNHRRPHSSLEYRTPAEFASGCAPSGSATLRLRSHTRRRTKTPALS
jgi:transposase InsO family protein